MAPNWTSFATSLVPETPAWITTLSPTFRSFRVAGESALFKLGLVTHVYRYGLFGRGFNRNGTIRNARDLAHDMLFVSVSQCHDSKREQQRNDCDHALHNFLLSDCGALVVRVPACRVGLRSRIALLFAPPASLQGLPIERFHFAFLGRREVRQIPYEHNELPAIVVFLLRAPCGHSGKPNAIVDDVEDLSVREFLSVGADACQASSDRDSGRFASSRCHRCHGK